MYRDPTVLLLFIGCNLKKYIQKSIKIEIVLMISDSKALRTYSTNELSFVIENWSVWQNHLQALRRSYKEAPIGGRNFLVCIYYLTKGFWKLLICQTTKVYCIYWLLFQYSGHDHNHLHTTAGHSGETVQIFCFCLNSFVST